MMYLSPRVVRCPLLAICQDPETFEEEYAALIAPQAQVQLQVVEKPVGVEGEDVDRLNDEKGLYCTIWCRDALRGKAAS